ncbi:hypothetical protein LIER_13201 [Lithospermum erythrorhizon]|uniref:Uncharacterized protein n=1 Tax=Lithospermum erythrorhizon TaxID=34254 RepID=A0AAV3PV06_LITER
MSVVPSIQSVTSDVATQPVIERHSTRQRQPSKWMSDYVVNSVFSSQNLPEFTATHKLFLANLLTIQELHTYNQATIILTC